MIKVDSLSRKYGDFTAVNNVSFDIAKGEIVGLLGHNGAGKTTILKMITGYLEPTEGTITIDGEELHQQRQLIQKTMGYLPENCPMYPEMTIIDYLDYAASLHGVPEEQRDSLVHEAIVQTGLEDKAVQTIATLSRGYRQRTGVAQAILHKPKILILDEPTNGLDPTQIQHMRDLITAMAKYSTVIISTHILQEVQAICDRAIIIKDGHKALDSRIDSLRKNSHLLVRTSGESDRAIAGFKDLKEVVKVEAVETNRDNQPGYGYSLSLAPNCDRHGVAAAVAAKIQSWEWQLYQLNFDSRDLESIFAEMSTQ